MFVRGESSPGGRCAAAAKTDSKAHRARIASSCETMALEDVWGGAIVSPFQHVQIQGTYRIFPAGVRERETGRGVDLNRQDTACPERGFFRTKPAAVGALTMNKWRIVVAAELAMSGERDVTFRQLFTDGRPLPKDPEPSFNGYSTGNWEGDTLVVQTIGFPRWHLARLWLWGGRGGRARRREIR
jgi:hypothetical protein